MIEQLTKALDDNRNKENAIQMEAYMKNQFPFFGIKTPKRRAITKEFFQEKNILSEPFQPEFVRELWNMSEREYQNIALDYVDKSLRKITKEHLPFIEELITTKSWWDTVDMLAQKPVGKIALDCPEVIPETIDHWVVSDNMWLRRSAIIFQLKYKEKTNEALLYQYIRQNAISKEFFIQKAIGWALREYSKTNPNSVRNFIQTEELAKLSIREGSKYL